MPLLLCPNDNGAMQTVQRSGVEFDICPTCRGVWLDRGELEKMLAAARDVGSPGAPPQDDRRRFDEDDRRFIPPRTEGRKIWSSDRDDDQRHQKKRRGLDIFDIFD